MKIGMFSKFYSHFLILAGGFAVSAAAVALSAPAQAQDMRQRPSLVITNERMDSGASAAAAAAGRPEFYQTPSRVADITPSHISGDSYYQPTQTVVAKKVAELRNDLTSLQSKVTGLTGQLRSLKERSTTMSSEYNASVATINTQLQAGTTPGNPRLVQRLSTAQGNLDRLSQNVADLNTMAVDAANAASMGSFLLEAARSTYGISGAVEEDHVDLANLEDQVNSTIVSIDRLLNDINDDITRTAAYLSAERNNLRTLSLAVTNGDYYGRSLAGRTFGSTAPAHNPMLQPASVPAGMSGGSSSHSNSMTPFAGGVAPVAAEPLAAARPLVKIRFDRPNVDYEQALYMAVSEATQRYPNARLELVAVHPSQGNAAQIAIESTRARRNAEGVLRSLTQMGIDSGRVDLKAMESAEARTSEVHVLIR